MKRLLLIRHAKASHESGFADFERPLKPEGLQDAAVMAGRLQNEGLIPQVLVSSPSLRTISTANIFSQHLSLPAAQEVAGIYEADQYELIDIVSQFTDDYDFAGIVGHNPGMGQLLYYFTGEVRDVPPCAVALIDFDLDSWALVSSNSGKLSYYDSPKEQ